MRNKKSKGFAMMEYVLGLSLLVFAIAFTPVSNGKSAIKLLEEALKVEYADYSSEIANPR
jgi:hypothetical protein